MTVKSSKLASSLRLSRNLTFTCMGFPGMRSLSRPLFARIPRPESNVRFYFPNHQESAADGEESKTFTLGRSTGYRYRRQEEPDSGACARKRRILRTRSESSAFSADRPRRMVRTVQPSRLATIRKKTDRPPNLSQLQPLPCVSCALFLRRSPMKRHRREGCVPRASRHRGLHLGSV
jgi:hypothetical protein